MGSFNRDSRGGGRSFGRRDFDRDRGGDRQMFKAVCSNCGRECEVPFRPTNGKPVYCSDCFEKMGNRRSDSPRPDYNRTPSYDRAPSFERTPSFDQNKGQFDALNAKLDRIIKLLEPKVVETPSAPVTETVVEEVKAPKKKKVTSSKKSK